MPLANALTPKVVSLAVFVCSEQVKGYLNTPLAKTVTIKIMKLSMKKRREQKEKRRNFANGSKMGLNTTSEMKETCYTKKILMIIGFVSRQT